MLCEMVVQERDLESSLTGERVRLVMPEATEFKVCGKRKEEKCERGKVMEMYLSGARKCIS